MSAEDIPYVVIGVERDGKPYSPNSLKIFGDGKTNIAYLRVALTEEEKAAIMIESQIDIIAQGRDFETIDNDDHSGVILKKEDDE
jgi:hypothetical protein